MNTIRPRLNQNKCERGLQFRNFFNFCAYTGFVTLFVCLVSVTFGAEETGTDEHPSDTNNAETQTVEPATQKTDTAENTGATPEMSKEEITGTANKMERYEKQGITILIDEAKTVRRNEQGVEIGYLNADKITIKIDKETEATTEIIAEGNVEIRDQDIFATCDHATLDNLTNTIILKDNVVVLQNKDRLETKLFTFNRTTGKQTGEGGVKFKVTVTQAAPVSTETDENTKSGTDTGEEKTSTAAPEKTEAKAEKEADAETDNADGDAEETPDADTGNAEDADLEEETDTDAGNPDDADADAETEASENN